VIYYYAVALEFLVPALTLWFIAFHFLPFCWKCYLAALVRCDLCGKNVLSPYCEKIDSRGIRYVYCSSSCLERSTRSDNQRRNSVLQ
jgi:hypothetical protein